MYHFIHFPFKYCNLYSIKDLFFVCGREKKIIFRYHQSRYSERMGQATNQGTRRKEINKRNDQGFFERTKTSRWCLRAKCENGSSNRINPRPFNPFIGAANPATAYSLFF